MTNPETPAPMTDEEQIAAIVCHYSKPSDFNSCCPEQMGEKSCQIKARAIVALGHRSSPSTAAGGWQAIETAPKDGTTLDLYHAETGRWPNCFWGKPQHDCGEMGQHCDSDWHRLKPGWVDGVFNEPITANFTRFSHYMLPAEPPK